MGEPNVLLLDEPTNDLDIETLNAVEDLLDGWAGTLVVVSHDRYFLERVCDRVVGLLGDGAVRDLPGGVDEYLRLRAAAGADASPTSSGPEAGGPTAPGDAAAARAARKELARIERRLDRLAEQTSAAARAAGGARDRPRTGGRARHAAARARCRADRRSRRSGSLPPETGERAG